MRRRRSVQLAVLGAAGLVLLATILAQAASAAPGSARRHSAVRHASARHAPAGHATTANAGASPTTTTIGTGTGTVSGTVTITGAPSGFSPPYSGAGACPDTGSDHICADPTYALAIGGSYSLSLAPGTWRLVGFYENEPFGGAFLGAGHVVTVVAGSALTRNVTVPYEVPASLTGDIRVNRIASGASVLEYTMLLCPSTARLTGRSTPLSCVQAYGTSTPGTAASGSASYSLTGLPPGRWIAYPGYCSQFGCSTNAHAGKPVHLISGVQAHRDVSTRFLTPGEGLLSATVAVTGAPTGFSPVVGVFACHVQTSGTSCEEYTTLPGSPAELLLADGTWQVTGIYLAAPFDNAVAGPTRSVTIVGGRTTTANLTVPYQVLGTAAGSITVAGLPRGVRVISYTVEACPVTGAPGPGISCVVEYSGPAGGLLYGPTDASLLGSAARTADRRLLTTANHLDSYDLPTLTPGTWRLSASYQTAYGTYFSPVGRNVTIVAGQTTRARLVVAYQAPVNGVVTGKVSVTGVPGGGYTAGVRACDALPTPTICAGEQDAFLESDGSYRLDLAPGTWWVSGTVQVFGFGPLSTEVITPPRVVQVRAGSHAVERFVVRAT